MENNKLFSVGEKDREGGRSELVDELAKLTESKSELPGLHISPNTPTLAIREWERERGMEKRKK